MIKKNHKFLFDALFKMFNEELKSWINNLHVVSIRRKREVSSVNEYTYNLLIWHLLTRLIESNRTSSRLTKILQYWMW
jgi:hypothetical protein